MKDGCMKMVFVAKFLTILWQKNDLTLNCISLYLARLCNTL